MPDLDIRKTHKYVGTHQDLDEWETIGTFKVLRSGPVNWDVPEDEDYDDYCDAGSRLFVVSVESDADERDIKQALRDHFSSHGCAHDYDCCGCISTHADALRQYGSVQWLVLTNSYRNY